MKTLSRFMNLPLRAKLAALMVAVSLLPLGVATSINIGEARERLVTSARDVLAARGDQLAVELDAFHYSYQHSVSRVAHLPDVVEFSQARPEGIDRLKSVTLKVLQVWPASDANIRGIAILDLSGTVKVATESPLGGLDLSYHSYVREALRGGAVISDIHLAESQVGYAPTIAYTAPVIGADGKLVGIVALWVRASALWDVMKKSNELAGPGSFAVLVDQKGIRIAHTYSEDIVFHPGGRLEPATVNELVAEHRFGEKTRQLLEDVRAFPEQFDRALSNSPDPGVFRGFAPVNQKWNYGVARRFEAVPWTVFYMVPEESLNAEIAQMIRRKALFAVVIVLIALVGGRLAATVLLKRVRSLSKATESIAGGNLAARVLPDYSDEIGRLGASFNSMADRIESQATALEKARDELDLRVRERTAELAQANESLRANATRLKASMESLRNSEERLHLAQEVARVGTFDWNIQTGMNRWTTEMEVMYGLPSGGFAGTQQAWVNLVHPEDRVEAMRQVSAALEDGNFEGEWRVVWPDGSVRWLAGRASVLKDEAGEPLRLIGVNIDITERKRAEEDIRHLNIHLEQRVTERTAQLETANKELEAFSYSVSHDLRAPLRAMDGFSQAVLEDFGPQLPEKGQQYLQTIRRSSQRMGELIDDLLAFARLSRLPLNKRIVAMDRLVRDALAELNSEPLGRQIEFRIGDLPLCQGDPALLKQVWINLLSNALKYTRGREPTVIEIGCSRQNGENVYVVRDNGVGFDMQYVHKLFGVFQRLHRTDEFEGTGVGLAIVQRIVHRHGGRIWVEAAVDGGATFFFTVKEELEP